MAYLSHTSFIRRSHRDWVFRHEVSTVIATWLTRIEAWRQIRAMENALAAAPFDMQKDLGWPAHDTGQARRDTVENR
ncbi:hypothetical protein [Allorhizobium taibaishanense]|uniref:DUF1127 domain-containing protein n=1 Tax=Allorhizobium taibaishanense TaxID=887144 RepID=A0A1Q9A0Y5_9HYPH|nr:hypothetical protein [Allorhizobium taibaishanense]MBB4007900.1 hypothetical protein [Allorhizobium taibaishanense]OLP48225.1 hypothetical protein BJF91_08805 [Allorhizobium taibaishanense]